MSCGNGARTAGLPTKPDEFAALVRDGDLRRLASALVRATL
jgi:hypothetical protein